MLIFVSEKIGHYFWRRVYAPKNLWTEGPLFRSSSSPKVVIFRRFHIPKGPALYGFYVTKVLLSEVHLVRRVLCSEDSIFRKSPLHYTGSILRGFFSPKFLYLEGGCVPQILFSEHRPWYTDSVLRRFFNPKVRKLYIVCSHQSPNDYLSISAIRCHWVCSLKSNARQDAHPMNRGSYFWKQRLIVCEIDL